MTSTLPLPDLANEYSDRQSLEQAVMDGKAYLDRLAHEATCHPALRHRWLASMAQARFPDMAGALRDFACTYHGYSAWFTRYLGAVASRLESPAHREMLEENLAEESGALEADDRRALVETGIDLEWVDGVPHSELFRRFCAAMDIGWEQLERVPLLCQRWRLRLLKQLQTAPAAFGIGAIGLGTEGVVKPIYAAILAGIQQTGCVTREEAVFFELHCRVDEKHEADLLRIAEDLLQTDRDRVLVRQGMLYALGLRIEIWDHLWGRAVQRGVA